MRWLYALLPAFCMLSAAGDSAAVPCGPRGIVFVADDAGGVETFSDALRQALQDCSCRLQVQQIRWNVGSVHDDLQNQPNHRNVGRKLAARVMALHHTHPGTPIYFVGFGAGSAVILCAAENLPPQTVVRILLLAPAVSPGYNLKPALCTSCEGIDHYYSAMDSCLHFTTHFHGTSDGRKHCRPAGLGGFQPEIECRADAFLYARLRQWRFDLMTDPSHNGGHSGYYNSQFLSSRVVPILCQQVGHKPPISP